MDRTGSQKIMEDNSEQNKAHTISVLMSIHKDLMLRCNDIFEILNDLDSKNNLAKQNIIGQARGTLDAANLLLDWIEITCKEEI